MNRAVADALLLVNWRGVFYERYLLDRHVTALEGSNGAGKTTVMIAAFVVLLPDLSRLRFTNLGETGATGGDRGIYGRLGFDGPAYSALEVVLPSGERVLLGVYLERKSEPSLSLKPFVVRQIPANLTTPLLLDRDAEHEEVPQFDSLKGRFEALGAQYESFSSAKDYFSCLFELGIGALRLGVDEERNKYSEMLRTSMTGGISRVLTSELRSFLFKEQSGLFDTLGRMRKNLDACRRTRLDVSESRVLEREIFGVFSAGQALFDCVHRGADLAVRQAQEQLELLTRQAEAAAEAVDNQKAVQQSVALRQQSIDSRLELARKHLEDTAEALRKRTLSDAIAQRLGQLTQEAKEAQEQLNLCANSRERTVQLRAAARGRKRTAQDSLRRAADGLSNLQEGLEQLHRRSHGYRQVLGYCEVVEAALGTGSAGADRLEVSLETAQARRKQLDADLAVADRAVATAQSRRQEYEQTREALRHVQQAVGQDPVADDASHVELASAARQVLSHLHNLRVSAQQVDELQRRSEQFHSDRQRRAQVLEQLVALELPEVGTGEQLLQTLREKEDRLARLQTSRRDDELLGAQVEARLVGGRQQLAELRERQLRSQAALSVVEQLNALGQSLPQSLEALRARIEECSQSRFDLQRQLSEGAKLRDQALQDAVDLEQATSQAPSAEMMELSERVDGQFLAERYEMVDPRLARQVQAQLGPWMDALVVSDPRQAAEAARGMSRGADSLYFVPFGSEFPLQHADRSAVEGASNAAASGDEEVIVETALGVRLTRLPSMPTVGREARKQRVVQLRAQAGQLDKAAQALELQLANVQQVSSALQALHSQWEYLPQDTVAERQQQLEQAVQLDAEQRQLVHARVREAKVEEARLQCLVDALKDLLPHTAVLDGAPGQSASSPEDEALAMERHLAEARGAAKVLEATEQSEARLLAGMHGLSQDVQQWDSPARCAEHLQQLGEQRDEWFRVQQAVERILADREALAWGDAAEALGEQERLAPQLTAQHDQALAEDEAAEQAVALAELEWEKATEAYHSAAGQLASLQAHVQRVQQELVEAQGPGDSSSSVEALEEAIQSGRVAVGKLEREQRGLEAEVAVCGERLAEMLVAAQRTSEALDAAQSQWQPLNQQATELELLAEREGLRVSHTAVQAARAEANRSPSNPGKPGGSGRAEPISAAFSHRELMIDRLLAAAGGADLAEQLRGGSARSARAGLDSLPTTGPLGDALGWVGDWVVVREWLTGRLPAPIAQLQDPHEGLVRLQRDLAALEKRLENQEGALKGTSSDVARSIEVQVRRASAQVRRLNQHLEGVQFGSISAIRVKLVRVERMTAVLRALREGETQSLLFQSDLPIEEALNEIFTRYGGGKGNGHRLVDFRQYIELSVEVQRRASDQYVRVNPSQVSTGEAIGVGAALMMVILSEWEREGNLMRRQRSAKSLRFLFLDEANRLSQDNLAVLFELCRNLDLQLLIAAPEVARSEGNTTYRLVRRLAESGEEEVVVSGRRAQMPVDPALIDATMASLAPPDELGDTAAGDEPAAVQENLFAS